LHEPTGDFLFAEFSRTASASRPLPPELFATLDRTNLVYYDRENTGERLTLLPETGATGADVTQHKQLARKPPRPGGSIASARRSAVTVTEVTQTAPNELTFTRQAPGGLTAIELTALANWLEATNFPGCDLRLPPPKPRIQRPRVPGAPVKPAPIKPAPVTPTPATAH